MTTPPVALQITHEASQTERKITSFSHLFITFATLNPFLISFPFLIHDHRLEGLVVVVDFINLPNPSISTMALGFTERLIEMSTRTYFWG
jgi:hypothetical protein